MFNVYMSVFFVCVQSKCDEVDARFRVARKILVKIKNMKFKVIFCFT